MTGLEEAVATALAPNAWNALLTQPDNLAQENRRKASLRHARAAIALVVEAMREPSEKMADVGESSLICGPLPSDLETSPSRTWAHAKSCYRAMIAEFERGALAPAETREG